MSVISFDQVNKWYGKLHALRDIKLDIAKGECIVICGPSGSGKSSLIRTINGLEPIDQGQMTVLGIEMTEKNAVAAIRRRVGMVFQSFNLFTHYTVIDNLTLAPENLLGLDRHEAEEKAMTLLERVGLADQAHKFPGQLSGGQQQRVAISRTLMMDPEILLFDEPTSALDPEMISEVLSLMEALAEQGVTMVCVTHEMGFARNVGDRILLMSEGCMIEQAEPETFFRHPRSPLTRNFLDKILR